MSTTIDPNENFTKTRNQIIAQSFHLPERIALLKSAPNRFKPNNELFQSRLTQWQKVLGKDRPEDIQERLDSLHIQNEDLPLLLGELTPSEHETIPEWWSICEAVLTEEPTTDDTEEDNSFLSNDGANQIAFEHALAPWIRVATKLLQKKYPDRFNELNADVLLAEQRGLLGNLAQVTQFILTKDFELSKLSLYSTNDLFIGMVSKTPPNTTYHNFTKKILEDNWHHYLTTFPALARLMATRVLFWVRTFGDFLERLETDRPQLEEIFSPHSPLGSLIKGGRGVSDSHNGGNAVVICTFENDCTIIYKPRPMSVDTAWNSFLDWLHETCPTLEPTQKVEILNRGPYGWMGFAEHKKCANIEEVQTYFQRMGNLLCLVHMLHGNDFHLENIIASGPNPIAIDLETITVADYIPPETPSGFGQSPGTSAFNRSVLRTLLLPMAMKPSFDAQVGNLGAVMLRVDGPVGLKKHRILKSVNTDFMHWSEITTEDEQKDAVQNDDLAKSKVELDDGTEVIPQNYRAELIDGYRKSYDTINAQKDRFLSENGGISLFKNTLTRFINRATNVYYRLLTTTYSDESMRSGLDRWLLTDRLAIVYSEEEGSDPITSRYLLEKEHESLFRGDIPCFYCYADKKKLITIDIDSYETKEHEHDSMNKSALSAAQSQIQGMSEDDRDIQIRYIESSYVTALISLQQQMHRGGSSQANNTLPQDEASDESLTQFARDIIDEIISFAWEGNHGVLDWVDVSIDPYKGVSTVSPIDHSIYGGRAGFVLLLDLAYRRFGEQRYLDTAMSATLLEADLIDRETTLVLSPSGMQNAPALIFAWWILGAHEEHGIWRTRALKLIDSIGPVAIARDSSYDIIGGSAGMILILAHIYREEQLPQIKQLVDKLAEHLVRHANKDHGGPAWKIEGLHTISLCGFGHGIAGIALALQHAWKITGKAEYRDVARRGIACEHGLRLDDHGTWPDFRAQEELPANPGHWCHGGAGIALARVGGLAIDDLLIAQEDIEFVVSTWQNNSTTFEHMPRPHLCCGTSGCGEIRRTIGMRTGRPDEVEAGNSIIRRMVHKQLHTASDKGNVGLGLMQGSGGLAWSALCVEGRAADPLDLLLLGT